MSTTVPKTSVPTPGVPTRMQLVVKSLKIILDALGPDDEFNIVTFGSGDPKLFKSDLQRVNSQNIDAAKTFLDNQVLQGWLPRFEILNVSIVIIENLAFIQISFIILILVKAINV